MRSNKTDSGLSIAVISGWSVVAAVLLWLGLFVFTGERFNAVRWISYLTPWLSGLLLILSVVSVVLRKRALGVCMLVPGMLLAYPYAHQFIPSQIDVSANQTLYKVMTYSKMGRNHDIGAVARVVLKEKPDILFMQEITEEDAGELIRLMSGTYADPLSFIADDHYGLILSRYTVISRLQKGDGSLAADIFLPEGRIRVWNVHLQKSLSSTDIQYKLVEQLAERVGKEDGPVLVAGDFNATVLNGPYVVIRNQLDNAFEKVGFGFGFTFPSPARRSGILTPFMRIDHIFYNSRFTAHQAYVVHDAGGSDHYPVVALMSLKKGAR